MTAIPFGAIVLIDFPFTDLTIAKRRPALVISTNNDRRTDVVAAYITSIHREDQDAIAIAATVGTGKTHLAIAIARSCIRSGARGRFYNVVDLVNRLESEARNARQGRIADHLTRMDFVIFDELGYLPFAHSGASSCSIWSAVFTSAPRSSSPPIWRSENGRACSAMPR